MTTAVNHRGGNIFTAIAGEHFVAGELSKRGWIATLTAKNTPGVDVLATSSDSDRFVRIDVKTRSGRFQGGWITGAVHLSGPHDFVVLVDLGNDEESPWYWIVPARTARELIVPSGGRIRISAHDVEEFEGRWELLDR